MPNQHLRVEQRDGLTRVQFLDSKINSELAISTLGDELRAIAAQPDCVKLILNFSEVEFFTSAMLGKLISTNRIMQDKGGTMVLCALRENLRMILRVTKLDNILNIRDKAEDGE